MAGETLTPHEMISRLVAFDTTSALSNMGLIEFVRDYLGGHGIASALVFNEDRTKANLIASIGPAVAGGVVLSGHTDVVPVADQNWDSDPFQAARRDGRLYGRGTADMKSFIAVALALVPEFVDRALKVPLHFAFSYDEEVGCLGVRPLLERLTADLPRPLLAIVGEPTEMKVANAHRGITAYITTARGRSGHSSAPEKGVNAIAYATRCAGFLNGLADEFRARPAPPGAGDFDPAYTTINLGRMEGGTAVNIIAAQCRLEWDCRAIPGADPDEARQRLDAYVAETLLPAMNEGGGAGDAQNVGITTDVHHSVPPLVPKPGSPAEAIVLALTGQNRCTTTAFASEGGLFQEAGIPAVICGPGSAAQAHQPNEFIDVSQVDACVDFLRKVAGWAAAPDGY